MIGFTSIAKEGMMLLMWTKIPVADDYIPKPKQKKQKKGLPKAYGNSSLIQGNVAHFPYPLFHRQQQQVFSMSA